MEDTTEKKIVNVDVVVVGAGPGGMTAALYASRANLKTIVLEKGLPGGEVNNTSDVENYPGFSKIAGPELAHKFFESAMEFGAQHSMETVIGIELHGQFKHVITNKNIYITPVVIIATGAQHRKLNIPGEDLLGGKGVSYCAVCDGFFFRNRHLVVVGGGDSAVEEGIYLTQFADKVTIIHRRDTLRAQQILQERAFKNEKIDFIWDATVEEIIGDQSVEGVVVRNRKTDETYTYPCEGVFIYIGLVPNSSLVSHLDITDEEGWIITNEKMETRIPGIFAVGDVRQTHLRQIATSVGDGSHAGHMAYQYIQTLTDQPS
ncbi:thioredoxin-disulfide reductase [Facklamia sp. 7083-14-GEN3]|uniref:thioredoxin-disulfide reductase n=1 Tax=Facklamia sp. 7083-14-GEN3 TaxID=2973478 RepID=UPI00215BECB8|nr:thioredoxin-disulfide reductase [Facklamia sp. 7083-14-GEN3]MCR8969649.1 thioredoxin-disulfide reductase [Facklamia sp. 7083-14-GEN3]